MMAMPSYDGKVHLDVAKALHGMDECGHEVVWEIAKHYDCAGGRTVLARKALDGGYDKVLWVDSDVILPEDALRNMLESKADMVFGIYPRKSDPTKTVVYRHGGLNISSDCCMRMDEIEPRIFPVKGGGLGCCLMDISVLKRVGFPWFAFEEREDGTSRSEDIYFCDKAYWAGVECDCDGRVRCGHVAEKVLY